MIGTSLNHYRITAKLGEGGMGKVYRATDTKLGREVAIKVLPASFSGDPQNLLRFGQEAKALAALNHPHIAAIYGFESAEGMPFLVLELVEGSMLSERLREGALSVAETLRIARQLAEAMRAAHEKGIIHRDLKPGNIMITPDGRVKVLDFGLAKTVHRVWPVTEGADKGGGGPEVTTVADITSPGTVVGTLSYMSPEQTRGQPIDQRTDVWAFGCCLFECLSGRKPFLGGSASDLIADILMVEPDWRAIGPETPPAMVNLLRRCLEKEVSRRMTSMGDIASLLDESTRNLAVPVARPDTVPDRTGSSERRQSIAVLPFSNIGADKENEYFSDGITEDLITALSQVKGLRVPARTSSFAFKDRRDDIRRIGRDLCVEMILEGAVRRAGNRLRVTAQLVNVADGFHVWSERFDRELKDVFEIQDEITGRVVSALTVQLGLQERERMVRKPTSNPEAYDLYLRGRYLWTRRQTLDLPKVLEHFEAALRADPGYALAYAGLADYYFYQAYFFGNLPFAETMAKARDCATKAVWLDETLGEARASLAFVHLCDWDFAGAASELQRAVELSPHYPTALHFRALVCWSHEHRLDDALALLQRASEIDPLSVPVRNMRAIILSQAGRHEEVILEVERMLEMDPHNVWEYIGRAYEQTHHPEKAIHWYLRWLEEDGASPEAIAQVRKACEAEGLPGYHRRLSELLVEQPKLLAVAPHWQQAYLVQAYAHLGRIDEAFRTLEQTFVAKSPFLIWFEVDLRVQLLRDDPRFDELRKRIGHS